MKALIHNGVVVQISEEAFEVNEALIWVDCPEDVKPEYTYENGIFKSNDLRTPEQIAEEKLADLRKDRNILLAQTDYLALADNTMTPEMEAYRQALRDITDTYSSLEDVVWPTQPE